MLFVRFAINAARPAGVALSAAAGWCGSAIFADRKGRRATVGHEIDLRATKCQRCGRICRPKSDFQLSCKTREKQEAASTPLSLHRERLVGTRDASDDSRPSAPRLNARERQIAPRLAPGSRATKHCPTHLSLPPGLARGPQTAAKASTPHPPKRQRGSPHKQHQDDRPLQPRPHGRAPPRRAAVDGGGLPAARRRAAHDARHSQSVVGRFYVGQWTAGLRLKVC